MDKKDWFQLKVLFCILLVFVTAHLNGQKQFGVQVLGEFGNLTNSGAIDTYDSVTDGYSPNGNQNAYGLGLEYMSFGIQVKKFNLTFKGDGFERPFKLLESRYDDFPRDWSGKGGSYYTKGYLFDGYSAAISKQFDLKHFSLNFLVEYGSFDVKITDIHETNELFSYSYNTKDDYTSRFWGYYDGGSYLGFGFGISRELWKGIGLYAGAFYSKGSFDYTYKEMVEDDLFPEDNIDTELNKKMEFNTLGYRIGIRYTYFLF